MQSWRIASSPYIRIIFTSDEKRKSSGYSFVSRNTFFRQLLFAIEHFPTPHGISGTGVGDLGRMIFKSIPRWASCASTYRFYTLSIYKPVFSFKPCLAKFINYSFGVRSMLLY
jgi:hypothetical protein